ncbi:cytochrome P450 736A117-like [Macadamia integrifolia]|uniref:cytochrome P450 736A117-like n=1 Tax=Macadamia integrifolia TaxID=60698 RepID=UPI001C4EAA85|nr:cytochrome P450 736A117-like [Macadamia integrifolia]XP_042496393.1 cytochrome P450 736A117-like [Macadamia integrifolia]
MFLAGCILLFLSYLLSFVLSSIYTSKSLKLPPSPFKLPIIGNLHQLGSLPHRKLQLMSKTHGPLMFLHFGCKPVLIVSSIAAVCEITKNHDQAISNRYETSFGKKISYNNKNIGFAPYGHYWSMMRKFSIFHLVSMKKAPSVRSVMEEETTILTEKIQRLISYATPALPTILNLSDIFMILTNDIICRMAIGQKYNGEADCTPRFKLMFQEIGNLLGTFNIADFIPWLGWVNFINGLEKRMEKAFVEIDIFLDTVIQQHRIEYKKKDYQNNAADIDLVDVLLQIERERTFDICLWNDNIKAILSDMFGVGTNPTSILLEWTMAEILKHPEVKKEVQEEVRGVTRGKENIADVDIKQMQYLNAVIKETLRLHPPLPLLIPRKLTKNVNIQGFEVPAKTMVIFNAWAIGRDPVFWDEPEKFKPERFLNDAYFGFNGYTDFYVIPFGIGRRECPCAEFAFDIVKLVIANLLHKFDWSLPWGMSGEDLDMTEATGISSHLKYPLQALVTPKNFCGPPTT